MMISESRHDLKSSNPVTKGTSFLQQRYVWYAPWKQSKVMAWQWQ